MKPFNLEAALRGEKVLTENGDEVNQLQLFKIGENELLVGVLKLSLDEYSIEQWHTNGVHPIFDFYKLFMAPKTKTYWVNVYKDETTYSQITTGKRTYHSKEDAIREISDRDNYTKTISFEIED